MENNGGFWRRVLTYIIDIIPIVIVIGAIFYFLYGFDNIIKARFSQPNDIDSRAEFLRIRNHIRDISFAVWVLYSIFFECSALQATLGKLAIGLKVVDKEGDQLSFYRSLGRNLFKFISLIALGLGFIWVAFTKNKQGWHDLVARTYVVKIR